MTLKQLEAFYWAATCANFAIAAERLHLSISSLSKRIAELEESLGVSLFDRSGHRAVLTEAGQELLPRTLELLDGVSAIRNSIGSGTGLAGRCTFGVGELSAITWLPRFVAQARMHYPKLILEPYVDVGAVLEERLEKGELDFAVIAGRSSKQSILSQPIAHAEFVWMAAPSLLEQGKTTVGDLLQHGWPVIALPPSAGTTRLIDDWLMAHRISSVERIYCNNWGAIAGMLIESVGIGILPQGWANKLAQRRLLLCVPDTPLPASLTYSFQWRRGDSRPLIDKMQALTAKVADFSAETRLPMSS